MKIQVRINEEGTLRNQRYAFTDRFTLLSELLQNARRAGAFHITVDHDAETKTLSVRDDGHGISDFQKLLSFNESGWDDGIAEREHPFGAGFTKCLYAATRVVVASGGKRVVIDTVAALKRASFEVENTNDSVDGTCVELNGVDLTGLDTKIETLCQGFPVDVVFNGRPLERRYAEDKIALMQTLIGAVHIAGNRDGKDTQDTLVFLQGFCVKRPLYLDADRVNVVHLNPQEFTARLPDRDVLIDSDQQLQRIERQIKQSWREILNVAKTQIPPQQFADTFYRVMRSWGHMDLLNTMDELPITLFKRIAGYPIQADRDHRDYLESPADAPSRADIEQGRVTLVTIDSIDEDTAACWMFARQRGWLVFKDYVLDAKHWIHPFVRRIAMEEVTVETLDVQASTSFDGRWVWANLVLCRAVRIRIGNDEVEITGEGVCHEGNILVPSGETSGEPVRQMSSYIDDSERFREDDMEADCNTLAELIRRLSSTDPVSTLDSLLGELQLGKYPLLQGRRFEIVVGEDGAQRSHAVSLLDAQPALLHPDGGHHA
ncbi:ATP-binding protein [Burkholderia vietnamiensis]|uniref:ATP-binding protein n=1 Tax=Burkholderia vietnamiensis TaxID=60552 RepID=UPI001D13CD58|nr:ATP-binding protein [Burkholderia vietnamiensis]UEC01756.1 ATP-binding protein [Burkholderia vietnamiensis]